jgi:crotonobetainyl-CoA:carnitine CoA-transferase CaiB-like acyl-CoA transferase
MSSQPVKRGKAALLDISVIDISDENASFCSKILADQGARVIKVERPEGGTERSKNPYQKNSINSRKSLHFCYHNTNKLSITLDIETEKGRDLFLRLVRQADAVIESHRPGYLAAIGLGFNILNKTNPRLILASVTGFGQTGPYSLYRSSDIVASAYGGQMYVSGIAEGPPLQLYGEQPYYTASLFAAVGILVALRARRLTGRGQHIDVSLQESVAATLEQMPVRYFHDGIIPWRQGALHWNMTSTVLPCIDGYILVTFEGNWETLVEWLDSEDMADDLKEPEWLDIEYRRMHADHIIDVLSKWTKSHTIAELFEKAQLMRFPWAPVQDIPNVFADPQLKDRGFFIQVAHPELAASLTYPGIPFIPGATPQTEFSPAPEIGEHNIQIYQHELGLSRTEMEELSARNII